MTLIWQGNKQLEVLAKLPHHRAKCKPVTAFVTADELGENMMFNGL